MALRIRTRQHAGLKLLAAIERAADGLWWDAAKKDWVATPPADPASLVPLVPMGTAFPWSMVYRALVQTEGWQGNYIVYVLNAAGGAILDGPMQGILHDGDDEPAAFPTTLTGTFKLS